jgi:hypothetical protein
MLPTTPTMNSFGSANWLAQITNMEEVTYKLTGFQLPEVNAGATPITSRNQYVYQESGDHIVYENLELTFIVDENLLNYRKLHAWMENNVANGQSKQESIFVHILDNNKKFQGVEVEFLFAFPLRLGQIEMDTSGATSDVTCTVTFAYTKFIFIDAAIVNDE